MYCCGREFYRFFFDTLEMERQTIFNRTWIFSRCLTCVCLCCVAAFALGREYMQLYLLPQLHLQSVIYYP